MPKFKSTERLLTYLQKSINDTLLNEVADEVRKVEIETIDEEVYSSYEPEYYARRYELTKEDNIVAELESDGVLAVRNIAPPNRSVIGGYDYSSEPTALSRWINEGAVPNIFNDYDYPWQHKRPFLDKTVEKLNSSDKLSNALKKGLIKRGLRVRFGAIASKKID